MTHIRDDLPPQEAQDAKDTGYGSWSHSDYLLASLIDSVNVNTWLTGQFKKTPPAPKPYPRPGVSKVSARKWQTVEELKANADPRALAMAEALLRREPQPED